VVLAAVVGVLYLLTHACSGSEPKKAVKATGQTHQQLPVTAFPTGGPTTSLPGGSGGSGGAGSGGSGSSGQVETGGGASGAGGSSDAALPAGSGSAVGGGGGGGGGGQGTCLGNMRVVTRADKRTYPAGVNPRIVLVVKNIGTVPCRVDLGRPELVITSGQDRIWSSVDCARPAQSSMQVVKPGGAILVADIAWARNRSKQACPSGLPAAKAGTYVAAGSVPAVGSNRVVFGLR
jgi:hypothetical protein